MKKLLIPLIYFSLSACNYINSNNIAGEYDCKIHDNVIKLKLTDTKEYVLHNDAVGLYTGTYTVDGDCICLNEGSGIVEKLRIINNNTLQFIDTTTGFTLYRIGSNEEVKHFSNSVTAVKTQSTPPVKQSSSPPRVLINQLRVIPPVVNQKDSNVSDTGGE